MSVAWTRLRALGPRMGWLLAVCALYCFGTGVFGVLLNLYLYGVGLREDAVGLLGAAGTAIGVLGSTAATSRFAARFSAGRLVALSILGAAAGMYACVAWPNRTGLSLQVLLSGGLGAAFGVAASPYVVAAVAPADRTVAFAWFLGVQYAGQSLGSWAAGAIPGWLGAPAATTTLRLTLLLVTGTTALAGLLGLFVLSVASRPSLRAAAERPPDGTAPAPGAWVLAAVTTGLYALGSGMHLGFFNVYLSTRLGASVGQIGFYFALALLLSTGGTLVGPALIRPGRQRQALLYIRLAGVPALLLVAAFPVLWVGAVGFVIRHLSTNLAWPLDYSVSAELSPAENRGWLLSRRMIGWYIGWSLGSWLGGQAILHLGYTTVFLCSAALMAAGTLGFDAVLRGLLRTSGRET